MSSNRRVATYGRVSRKKTYDFQCSASYLASEKPALNIWAKKHDLVQEGDHIPTKNLVCPPGALGVNSCGNDLGATRCTRSMTRPPYEAEPQSKISGGQEKSPADMLPSNCEVLSKFDMNRKRFEKKESLDCGFEAKVASLLHDDRNLQCHNVAEAPTDKYRVSAFGAILKDSNNLKKNCPASETLQSDHQDQYLQHQSAISQRGEREIKGSEPLKMVSQGRRMHHRPTITKKNHLQKDVDLGIYANQMRCSTSDNSRTDPGSINRFQTSSKTPQPKILRSVSPSSSVMGEGSSTDSSRFQGTTQLARAPTSQQRELWDMLLKRGVERDSSLTPEQSSLMSANGDVIGNSHSNDQWGQGSREDLHGQRRKRRRLVDHLNACEAGKYKTDDALVDQETSNKVLGCDTILDALNVTVNPSLGESRPLITPSQDQSPNATSLGKLSMPLQGGRLKVTYARQRSFVDDDVPGATVDVAVPTDPPQLQSKWHSAETVIQTKSDDSLEESVNSQSGMMRSIYELRKAGSNARAIGNMEALFDEVKGETGLSLECRVSRLLDLIVKLQDIPYCRLFISQGLDLRLLSCLDVKNGLALKALFAAAILNLLVPSICLSKLHQTTDPRLSNLLLELLGQEGNLEILVKKAGFMNSGIEQTNFRRSWDTLLKSAAWGRFRPRVLTARVISLQCLEYLARQAHKSSQPAAAIQPHVFWSVARILNPDFSVSVRKPNAGSQLDAQLALSILETYTIGDSSLIEETIWKGKTLGYLKGFLPLLNTWREEEIGTLKTLTLRLYLNLMNNRPNLCKAFATADVVSALLNIIVSNFRCLAQDSCDDPKFLLDDLILALGSMINLAEWCHTAPQLVMILRFEDASFLDILLQIYTSKQVEAQEVSEFLSILLGDIDWYRSFLNRMHQSTWHLAIYLSSSAIYASMNRLETR